VNGYSSSSCEIRASFKIHPYFKGSPKKMTESSDKQIPKSKKSNIKLKFKGSPKKMTLIQVSNKSDPNRKAEDSRSPSSAKVMAKKKIQLLSQNHPYQLSHTYVSMPRGTSRLWYYSM